ncbi:hypothetical protein [Comamonas resistens]|uniref:Uncharacterized protein n=1 Tax=Comamonas resistens TaxID=3046670 RepID=A0ABY8SUL6_9BURK|nr:hypothetical protein [Comamonas resistens]MDL5035189.1 hypothetical protein [Comamonas resistens]WHS66742.1 hypothetical protein QMY55_06285 [Comamonas resistens]
MWFSLKPKVDPTPGALFFQVFGNPSFLALRTDLAFWQASLPRM